MAAADSPTTRPRSAGRRRRSSTPTTTWSPSTSAWPAPTNCAGGVTPWGTWLTCEETEDRTATTGSTKDHGFVFEVDPVERRQQREPDAARGPRPLRPRGRRHRPRRRGSSTSPRTPAGPTGCSTGRRRRRRSAATARCATGRALEALVAYDGGGFVADLSEFSEIGTDADHGSGRRSPTRSPTEDVDPRAAQQGHPVSASSRARGGATDAAYIVVSYARIDDGSVGEHDGQVWRLDPAANTMELSVQFGVNPDPASDTSTGPTTSPCRRGAGCPVRRRRGRPAPVHRQPRRRSRASSPATCPRRGSEFTGATFSADGQTLFVNLQIPGVTFADHRARGTASA